MSSCVENLSAPKDLFTPVYNIEQFGIPSGTSALGRSCRLFPRDQVQAVSSLCTATIEQATRSTAASSNPPGAAFGPSASVDGHLINHTPITHHGKSYVAYSLIEGEQKAA
jgi:hypothetical protein